MSFFLTCVSLEAEIMDILFKHTTVVDQLSRVAANARVHRSG